MVLCCGGRDPCSGAWLISSCPGWFLGLSPTSAPQEFCSSAVILKVMTGDQPHMQRNSERGGRVKKDLVGTWWENEKQFSEPAKAALLPSCLSPPQALPDPAFPADLEAMQTPGGSSVHMQGPSFQGNLWEKQYLSQVEFDSWLATVFTSSKFRFVSNVYFLAS